LRRNPSATPDITKLLRMNSSLLGGPADRWLD
jgi:hypothetical protein